MDSVPIRLLIIDDDPGVLSAMQALFRRAGHQVIALADPSEAAGALAEEAPDVVLTDVRMPLVSGMEILALVKAQRPDAEVILMTAFGSIQLAVEAVKKGAYDFLLKPFDDVSIVELAVRRAAERKRLRERTRALEAQIEVREEFEGLVGGAQQMKEVYRMVETVAHTDATVLILGERGTGKELVAKALHLRSPRKDQPFLVVNCSSLPQGLIESELFGHAKGAFTGAVGAKKGLFEAAHRGTVFLDEIADLPLPAQVQLLRTLQEGEVRRVGSVDTVHVDVRVVAATNVDLAAARAKGSFRDDLYDRLNVISIRMPALHERGEDIPLLAHHFVQRSAGRQRKPPPKIGDEVMELLLRYPWPGNVRELENAMERAVILCQGDRLVPGDLPPQIAENELRALPEAPVLSELQYTLAKQAALSAFERRYLGAMMRRTKGNLSEAARLAGMDRSNFRRLLKAAGIDSSGSVQPLATGPDGDGSDAGAD